ncbi:MAG: proline dehydrogenase family protein [Candidatus Yanofskybacteria bacterium]|nr:proline dehydrogenase family protein [Candidatus Yanofskybacteria bacterium]
MKINFITRRLLAISRQIFIAGKTQEETLAVAEKLNGEGFLTTIDILGEHSKSEEGVKTAYEEYKRLLEEIGRRGLKTTISIKLTHLGLELGFGYCFNVVKKIVRYARSNNVGIEFDMEEFKYNLETIEIFQSLSKPTDNNRLCLQANIFNSFYDLDFLHDKGYPTRLVKGAYQESSEVAYYNQIDIEENFISLINLAISKTILNRHNNICGPSHAIGTRDKKIIRHAKILIEASPILEKNCIEFQLLHGYLALGRELLQEGYPVRIYLPYGDDKAALPYVLRRLKNPHAWKLLFDWLLNFGKARF